MNTPQPDPKNLIAITPADQRRAAELIQAAIVCEGEVIDVLLAEAAAEGIDRALALVAVMTRWTAVALVDQHGRAFRQVIWPHHRQADSSERRNVSEFWRLRWARWRRAGGGGCWPRSRNGSLG